ncbi:MAG TPA: DUF4149 domain-containing protein [Gallionella sp.]|nr:DUF4149 domain-containing protein [Gallionella sp.]OGS67519.1 MAG: hypothetical protein A2Z87_04980 [Gallionellales bacterium GWA2_54_124]OGT23805.1 MAG: hypothetical protein A3K00_05460 [Gallionellales bacterium RIFOXYD2_FULL_52_7]HCI52352.1 DUF4149 domain-containing protein [Gallionella sp.]
MKNITDHLAALSLTAWTGSLWAIGYLAVPVLFHAQPDRQLAGMLAGEMFTVSGYLGLLFGSYLIFYFARQSGRLREPKIWIVAIMLLLTLIIQFGIQPVMSDLKLQAAPLNVMDSSYAARFKLLHGISSIAYLVESLLGLLMVIKGYRPTLSPAAP